MGKRVNELFRGTVWQLKQAGAVSGSVTGQFWQNATTSKGKVPYQKLIPGEHALRADYDALCRGGPPLTLDKLLTLSAPKRVWVLHHLGRISLPDNLVMVEETKGASGPVDIQGKPIASLQGFGTTKKNLTPIDSTLELDWQILGQSIDIDPKNRLIRPSRGFFKARSERFLRFSQIVGFEALNLKGLIAESAGVTLIRIDMTSSDNVYLWFNSWGAAWPVNLDEPDGDWYIGPDAVAAALNWMQTQLSPKA